MIVGSSFATIARVPSTKPPVRRTEGQHGGGCCNSGWQRMATRVAISEPGDAAEREADRVAEQVVQHGAAPAIQASAQGVQRMCSQCEEQDERQVVQRSASASNPTRAAASDAAALGSLRGRGQALPEATRTSFESSFGRNFGDVRIHTDDRADALASAFQASAFTYGNDIVFARGQFAPDTNPRLLAHELAHVVQQARGEPSVQRQTPPPASRVSPRQLPTVEAWANDDMPTLLGKMRGLRAKGTLRPEVWGSGKILVGENRIKAAALTAENEVLAASARKPEDMAELRERMIAGSVADRTTIESEFPAAKIPTAPTLPSAGLPSAPAKSKHAGWPTKLIETVYFSWADRLAGMPGSRKNIDNAFWGRRPTDVWDALDAMGSADAVIKAVYDMWIASGISWSHVRSIRHIWSGSSMGFDFNSSSISKLRAEIEASTSFCKDKNGGDLYHDYVEGTAPCWRQTVTANTPGLHFCLGGGVPTVHIDPHQVVEQREADGTCNYDMSAVRQHFKDLGWWPGWL